MPVPDAATANYEAQQRIAATTSVLARRVWSRLFGDFDAAWRTLGPQLLVVISAGQRAAVQQATEYVPAVLDELNVAAPAVAALNTSALVGVASDGRALASLLYEPVITAKTVLGNGRSLDFALESGRSQLDRIVLTQVQDAGREAESVESIVRPKVTRYARMLVLPSCPRCVILAGRVYGLNAGFSRHPQCDCRRIPSDEVVAGDLTTDPRKAIESGQVHGLSKADTQAILDGANPAKVINAHRGMYTAGGQKFTREGTRRRGVKAARLRPESIYKAAGADRDMALRLLRQHGYIL